jgi:hypothetical protein
MKKCRTMRLFEDGYSTLPKGETMKIQRCFLLVAVVTLATSTVLPGAIVTFSGTDFGTAPAGLRPNSNAAASSFDAAAAILGTTDIITFENVATGAFTSKVVYPGVTVTFTGGDTALSGVFTGDDVITGYNTTVGGANSLHVVPTFNAGTISVTFSFSSPVAGFGSYLTGVGTASGILHTVFNDGTSHDITVQGSESGGVQFSGFQTSSNSISSFTLELREVTGSTRDIFAVDDVRLVSVPEPATLSILTLGCILMARGRRLTVRK